jgi:putative transposase
MWFQQTEGTTFGMQVIADLKNRGVQDNLISCVDGLKALAAVTQSLHQNRNY